MIENTVLLLPEELRVKALKWFAFMENDIDNWPFGGLVHQKRHWARVLVNAFAIGAHEGLSDKDFEALAMAAAFHDSRRKDSWLDYGHGARAAEYYKEYCESGLMEFDPRAYLAIKNHDVNDGDGFPNMQRWDEENVLKPVWYIDARTLYRIFKDADGLDRLRLNPQALDMSYLRVPFSRERKPFAEELLTASREAGTWPTKNPVPRKYLVVVDVQNDFIDGSLGTPEARKIRKAIIEKVTGFDGTVVFTKDTHTTRYLDSAEGKGLPVEHCIVNTEGWNLEPAIKEFQEEKNAAVYLKGTYGSMDLAHDLEEARARGNLSSIEIIGLCTDICVLSNALLIRAQMPEVEISLDSSCCAGSTPGAHDAALAVMKNNRIEVR